MDNGDDDCTYEQVGAQNKLKHAFPLKIINKWPRFGKKDEIDVVTKRWKKHVKESRDDIASEKDCAGLTRLERWHYGLFETDTTKHNSTHLEKTMTRI